MIPAIGLMIAAYVFTRMWQIILRRNPKENGFVVICACGTLLVAVLASAQLGLGSLGPVPLQTDLREMRAPTASAETSTPSPSAPNPLLGTARNDLRSRFGEPTRTDRNGERWFCERNGELRLTVYFYRDQVSATAPAPIDWNWRLESR
jgi:hypothetical protein